GTFHIANPTSLSLADILRVIPRAIRRIPLAELVQSHGQAGAGASTRRGAAAGASTRGGAAARASTRGGAGAGASARRGAGARLAAMPLLSLLRRAAGADSLRSTDLFLATDCDFDTSRTSERLARCGIICPSPMSVLEKAISSFER